MRKIRIKLVDICKKNQLLRTILRKIISTKYKIQYSIYKSKNKTDEKLIVFTSFMGRTYSCSPKAIYEEMINNKKYKDYTFIWGFKNPESKKSIKKLEKAILVEYKSKKFLEYCSKAKFIISNSRLPESITFREEQKYVQCWHGTPLKKLGYDLTAEGGNALNSLKEMKNKYKEDSRRYTYLLSPSKFTTEKLTSAFNLKENNKNVKIIEQGYPRNELMFKFNDDDIKRIKIACNISLKDKRKIILYAPTWRDNQHTSGVGYTYNLGIDFDKLQSKLEKDYILLFRPHYFVANKFDFKKYKNFIVDVSSYEDITDLYCIADMLITDYSSVFFDYANLKRPILFYMYDKKEYEEDIRGFYISLDQLPGPIVEKENDLIREILNIDKGNNYIEKYKEFNRKYNYLDDGTVSKRVLKELYKKQ